MATPSKENVPTANAHNIIEENTQLSNLNTTSDETNDSQPPILTNSLPTSTAPITSPPDNTHEETTKPHPQNIVMTSDKVTSNQIPLPENSVPTSPPPDNKHIQDEKQAKPHPPNIATSDEVTDNQAPLPTENSSSTSLTTSSPDDMCIQDEKQKKPLRKTSPLRKTPSKENVIITIVPPNVPNIREENTQLSNLNTSDKPTDSQLPIPTNSLPTSTALITSPPDDTYEKNRKPHPQNIVMTSDDVTSNQTPLPENSVPTSLPQDSKGIKDKEYSKPHPPSIATSDEVTDSQAPLPTETSSSTSLTTSSPDDTCTQNEKQNKPHPPNIATSDEALAPLPTETSSSTSLVTLPPDGTCTQNEKQKKPHPPNLVTITNKPKAESSSVPSSQVNRDLLLTENLSVTTPPPDNKHTQDKECTNSHPQNLITSNKLDISTDNSSVPSSPLSLAKELLPLPTESTSPITIAHIISPSEYIPDIEHHDDDPMDLLIQQHLQLEQDPLIADDHENLELEPIDIPSLIQPDNQPLLQLEPEFVYLTPAIQETGEDNMPPNVVVGSLPHLPHSMEDSLVCTSNNSYNTTSDHSSNNRELVRY